MTPFSTTHLIFLAVVVAFLAGSMWLISKLPRKAQTVMIFLCAICCAGGIFFRYGMGLSFDKGFTWSTLAKEMLQVCNFNFILVLLMLIPKFEFARQYAIFFSMFAASTTLFSLSSSWKNLEWYDINIMNSLINHVLIIALPLWMLAARRLKPRKDYVIKVTLGVIGYMTIVAIIVTALMKNGIITENPPHYSFIYDTYGIGLLEWLYELIPYPYFYLYPLIPFMFGFFCFLAWAFRKYEVEPFTLSEWVKVEDWKDKTPTETE